MKTIDFNINDHVRIKLTPYGRAVLKERNDRLTAIYPGLRPSPFQMPKEDEAGWSEWQLWELMHEFGKDVYNGCQMPFETTIQIEVKESLT